MKTLLSVVAGVGIALSAAQAVAQASSTRQVKLEIESQILRDALTEWAQQTGYQIVFSTTDMTREMVVPGVHGSFSPQAALLRILENTPFMSEWLDERTVAIRERRKPVATKAAWRQIVADVPVTTDGATSEPTYTRVAQANTQSQTDTSSSSGATQMRSLEEVIVTAQKRSENLLEVPSSISAIGGERLELLQVGSLSELSGYVPSLTLSSYGAPGLNTIEIRGLASGYLTDFVGPLVATYIDEQPVGSSTSAGRGNLFSLDLMPYDIERVEVLKGPQGTLYGANAMAGLIKYALRKPDLSIFEARVGTSAQHVDGSEDPDWGARGALNVPLISEKLALRLSGFHQDSAGYIDNIGTGSKAANHATQTGGRGALLWQPSDAISLQAGVIAQDVEADDLANVTLSGVTFKPLYGAQTTRTLFPQLLDQTTRSYSLSLNWDLGFANLSSAAGWSELETLLQQDYSDPYARFGGPDSVLSRYSIDAATSKFVEETRLMSPQDQRTQWMVGAYYTKEDASEDDDWPTFTANYVRLPFANNLFVSHEAYTYKEAALFANVTHELSKRFDLSGGLRYSRYEQSGCGGSIGIFGGGVVSCENPPSTDVLNWMMNARFHLNDDAMVYTRVATGYRPGNTNTFANIRDGAPADSDADETIEYEVGFKSALLDRRLQIETAAFYIDWKELQSQTTIVGQVTGRRITFVTNLGSAVSRGVEMSSVLQATEGLRLNTTLAYTDAYLSDDSPNAGGKKGDQLPLSARWAGSFAADYSFPIGAQTRINLGTSYRYRDTVFNQFPGANGPPGDRRAPIRPWNILDAYVGLEVNRLSIRFYGRNVTDHRSYSGLQFMNNTSTPRFIPIQQLTFGLGLDYEF